jgi:hypothetical protein
MSKKKRDLKANTYVQYFHIHVPVRIKLFRVCPVVWVVVEVINWHHNGDLLWNSESIDDHSFVAVTVCPACNM